MVIRPRPRPQPTFRQSINRPAPRGPEHNVWWWNPRRFGVAFAPIDFRTRLKKEMGEELEVTWNPIIERWQVWARTDRVNHPVCQGWRLLFIHNGPSGEYLPLNEIIFARLYSCSAEHQGSGKQYFDRITREMERDKARRDKQSHQDLIDSAMPSFEHSKIQVSGFGKSNGSKFADYLA